MRLLCALALLTCVGNLTAVEPDRPFVSELMTKWGEQVKPDAVWAEYPRPLLVRDAWTNLNGPWDYAVTPKTQANPPAKWVGKLLVPFCLESKLGGVQRLLKADQALWYHRTFAAKPADKQSVLLHFEAVDYRCEVFVNGQSVGTHVGGHTPFQFDIAAKLKDGENELVVRVEDETEGWQLRGKQTLNPKGIWYTQVSGIWQTVWLEPVPQRHLDDLKITTAAAKGTITVRPVVGGGNAAGVKVTALDGKTAVATATGPTAGVTLTVPNAKLWTPDTPFLYDLEVTLLDEQQQPLETVRSYAGIRTLGKTKDAAGHLRLTLNGKEIFHFGPLDQGWWPDGLLTPPSDAAMKADIEYLKAAGFNMIRKHIKVEPRRYYHHCDQLGMMVWQDQVSAGHNPKWTRLQPNPKDADWPDDQHAQWMLELGRMIDELESYPSIVMWVPFNEAWGQHRTTEVGQWTAKRDPTRPVNIASGGNFWPVGDMVDAHKYPHPDFPFDDKRDAGFVKVMGEFGGHGWPVKDHLWDANRRNWGYGDLPKTVEELRARYATSIEQLIALKARGIAAGVYTQTTDVEGEINGLLTYDRRVVKIPAADLAKWHAPLYAAARPTPPRATDSDFAPDQSRIPTPAPKGATVLLDDKGRHAFRSMAGGTIDWPVEGGVLTSTSNKKNQNHIVSTLHFKDADIHVEFLLPEQGPGNSGVYIHGNYEIQILNSFGKEKVTQDDVGAVYGFSPPLVNACRKPGEWQVFDIRYRAPRRDEAGKITENGTATVWFNGQKVQERAAFGEPKSSFHPFRFGNTPYLNAIRDRQKKTMTGPVFLQDHGNPVQFRNVWVKPLDDAAFTYAPEKK